MKELLPTILCIAIGLNIGIFGLGATLANTDLMIVALLSCASCFLALSMRPEDNDDAE